MRVTVIGCGRWGSFLAWYVDRLGHRVSLFGRPGSAKLEAFRETRSNGLVTLSPEVDLTSELPQDAALVVRCFLSCLCGSEQCSLRWIGG